MAGCLRQAGSIAAVAPSTACSWSILTCLIDSPPPPTPPPPPQRWPCPLPQPQPQSQPRLAGAPRLPSSPTAIACFDGRSGRPDFDVRRVSSGGTPGSGVGAPSLVSCLRMRSAGLMVWGLAVAAAAAAALAAALVSRSAIQPCNHAPGMGGPLFSRVYPVVPKGFCLWIWSWSQTLVASANCSRRSSSLAGMAWAQRACAISLA